MFTNDLKKGNRVTLRNGWSAELYDNMKGNTRLCKVYGDYTEIGSVYAHDIVSIVIREDDKYRSVPIEHTPAQLKLRKIVEAF